MGRGPLYEQGYSPQFSGHETFPLRYGWLKKAFDRVEATEGQLSNRAACWGEGAIARFGVGRNMVASMRHWAKAARVIKEPSRNSVRATVLGRMLFRSNGLDPFMEHPSTLWLVHWQLAARRTKTTWFWAFSHYPAIQFEREVLVSQLVRLAKRRGWKRVSKHTVENDVRCFIRTYSARLASGKAGHDDSLESPLTELGIVKAVGKKDGFRFARGPKPTLGDGAFTYALIDFWSRYSPHARVLSFEAVAHAPGGPGRVFLLDENDVVDRLVTLDDTTRGALLWSETAGLKQVVRNFDVTHDAALSWIGGDYGTVGGTEAT